MTAADHNGVDPREKNAWVVRFTEGDDMKTVQRLVATCIHCFQKNISVPVLLVSLYTYFLS